MPYVKEIIDNIEYALKISDEERFEKKFSEIIKQYAVHRFSVLKRERGGVVYREQDLLKSFIYMKIKKLLDEEDVVGVLVISHTFPLMQGRETPYFYEEKDELSKVALRFFFDEPNRAIKDIRTLQQVIFLLSLLDGLSLYYEGNYDFFGVFIDILLRFLEKSQKGIIIVIMILEDIMPYLRGQYEGFLKELVSEIKAQVYGELKDFGMVFMLSPREFVIALENEKDIKESIKKKIETMRIRAEGIFLKRLSFYYTIWKSDKKEIENKLIDFFESSWEKAKEYPNF